MIKFYQPQPSVPFYTGPLAIAGQLNSFKLGPKGGWWAPQGWGPNPRKKVFGPPGGQIFKVSPHPQVCFYLMGIIGAPGKPYNFEYVAMGGTRSSMQLGANTLKSPWPCLPCQGKIKTY